MPGAAASDCLRIAAAPGNFAGASAFHLRLGAAALA